MGVQITEAVEVIAHKRRGLPFTMSTVAVRVEQAKVIYSFATAIKSSKQPYVCSNVFAIPIGAGKAEFNSDSSEKTSSNVAVDFEKYVAEQKSKSLGATITSSDIHLAEDKEGNPVFYVAQLVSVGETVSHAYVLQVKLLENTRLQIPILKTKSIPCDPQTTLDHKSIVNEMVGDCVAEQGVFGATTIPYNDTTFAKLLTEYVEHIRFTLNEQDRIQARGDVSVPAAPVLTEQSKKTVAAPPVDQFQPSPQAELLGDHKLAKEPMRPSAFARLGSYIYAAGGRLTGGASRGHTP